MSDVIMRRMVIPYIMVPCGRQQHCLYLYIIVCSYDLFYGSRRRDRLSRSAFLATDRIHSLGYRKQHDRDVGMGGNTALCDMRQAIRDNKGHVESRSEQSNSYAMTYSYEVSSLSRNR